MVGNESTLKIKSGRFASAIFSLGGWQAVGSIYRSRPLAKCGVLGGLWGGFPPVAA